MKQQKGTKRTDRMRLVVYRSNQHIYAQIIDDTKGITLVNASDADVKLAKKSDTTVSPKIAIAHLVGLELAKRAVSKKIVDVWFDRRQYRYHGRVQALAEGARSGGLNF